MTDNLNIQMRIDCGWTWKCVGESRQFTDSASIHFRRDSLSPNTPQDIDIAWYLENQTLVKNATTTYNLRSLSQLIFGKSINFTLACAKILYVYNRSAVGTLSLGDTVTNQWIGPFGLAGDELKLAPNSPLFITNFTSGWSVDPSTCNLKLNALGGDVSYDIAILGTSPDWVAPSPSSSSADSSST